MIRTSFFQLAFCFVLIIGFSCSFAFAEEVELIPSDSFELVCNSTYTGYTSDYHLELERATNAYPFTTSGIIFGDSTTLNLPSDAVYLYRSGYGSSIAGVPVDYCAYSYYGYQMYDFSVNYKNLVISLDMENYLNGYYRYETDFLLGVFFVVDPFQYSIGDYDLTPSYTYDSHPFYIGDSESGMHIEVVLIGEQEYTYKQGQSNVTVSLLKLHAESTFYYDSAYGTDLTFNLESAFQNLFSSLSFDVSSIRNTGRSQTAYACYNTRIWSSLFSNVDPPITPTPSPTPYPGQDTQESINSGVQQIVTDLNISATPIPVPSELAIDETIFDVLETMTLPDISEAETSFTDLWSIFDPLWVFLGALFGSLTVVGLFLYFVRGCFI